MLRTVPGHAAISSVRPSPKPLGRSLPSWKNLVINYASLSSADQEHASIEACIRRTGIQSRHRIWLGFSPFGYQFHIMQYLTSRHFPLHLDEPRYIATYGAGFHDDTAACMHIAEQRYARTRPSIYQKIIDALPLLQRAQSALYGKTITLQPRKLILHLLPKEVRGELVVFDRNPLLSSALEKPHFTWINFQSSYLGDNDENLLRYWRCLIDHSERNERGYDKRFHGDGPTGPLISRQFDLSSLEMSKMKLVRADIASDCIESSRPDKGFGLSIALQILYFIPGPLRWLALARIVHNMALSGLLLVDNQSVSEGVAENLGLARLDCGAALPHSLHVYHKVENSDHVSALARIAFHPK